MHPHNVHDVQADAGADPGYSAAPGHQVKGFRAVDSVHATVVDWHDGDADHKKDRRHGDAIGHIGPRGLGVPKHLEEPAETQHAVNNGVQMDVRTISKKMKGSVQQSPDHPEADTYRWFTHGVENSASRRKLAK